MIENMARATGLEPAASGVTGRRSNQLSYARSRNTRSVLASMGPASACDHEALVYVSDAGASSEARATQLSPAPGAARGVPMVGGEGIEPPTSSV